MKRTLLFLVATFVSAFTFAQEIASTTFTDNNTERAISKALKVVVDGDFAYIGGKTQNGCGTTPYVQKVNMVTGEVIWNTASTSSYVEFEEEFGVFNIRVIGDDLYAMLTLGTSSPFGRMWRIDKTTGEVIWKIQWLNATEEDQVYPYSATQVMTYSYYKFRLVNISNGAVTATHNYDGWGVIGVGKSGDIYLPGNPLQRVSNFDWANPTDFVDLQIGQGCNGNGSMIAEAHETDDNKLLIFGFPCAETITLVDINTKQILWKAVAGELGYDFSSFSIKGNDLFVSYKPSNGENMLYGMRASRINFSTGQVIWNSVKFFSREYDHDTALEAFYRPQGNSMSVDGDSEGNVYLTGVAGTNTTSGDWGIMKLAAANGDLVYEKIIAASDKRFDNGSQGLITKVLNDVPYFIGNMLVPYDLSDITNDWDGPRDVSLVKLDATTGATQNRTRLLAPRRENSKIQKVKPLSDNSTLILENKGPALTVTRYGTEMNAIWTKEFSFQSLTAEANFIAADLAVDKDGNIVVLAEREVRETLGKPAGYYPNDLFFLDKDGNTFRQEGSGFTNSPDNELLLAANKEDFYLLNGINQNGAEPSVIRFSKDDAIQGGLELGIELVPTHTPNGRRMAQLSDGRLLIIGKDLTTRISNPETLQTTESNSRLFSSGDLTTAHDITILRDTLYVAAMSDNNTHKSLFAYSMITRQAIWSYNGTAGQYYKLVFDTDESLYVVGNNGDGEVLVHKLDRKTGSKVWTSTLPAGNVNDMIYDTQSHEIVLTGSTNVGSVDYFSTMALNAFDGETIFHDIQQTYPGTGLTVNIAGNGTIIAGGQISGIDVCVTSSLQVMFTRNAVRPTNVIASDDLDNGITVTWSQPGGASHSRIFRSTENDPADSQPITEWISADSYHDETAVAGVLYYYFVKSAHSDVGDDESNYSSSDVGARILAAPEIESVGLIEENTVEVTWTEVEAAEFYRVYRGTTDDPDAAVAVTEWITAKSYADNTVADGNTYFYFIKAATDEDGSFASHHSNDGEIFIPAVTGIDDGNFAAFAIYPNPTKEQFTIRYDSEYHGIVKVNLLSAVGSGIGETRLVKDEAHFEHTFSLGESVRGTIIVVVKEGERVTYRKVVKL